jgi:outer membrane protein
MKKTALLLIIAFALVSVAVYAQSSNVVVLDMQKVMKQTSIGKALAAKLEKERKAKENIIKAKQDQIIEVRKKLQNSVSVLTESRRLALKQEDEKLQLEYKELLQKARADIQRFSQQLNKDYNQKLVPLLEKLAREKGYTLVLMKSQVVWSSNAIDISDEFIKRVNASVKGK